MSPRGLNRWRAIFHTTSSSDQALPNWQSAIVSYHWEKSCCEEEKKPRFFLLWSRPLEAFSIVFLTLAAGLYSAAGVLGRQPGRNSARAAGPVPRCHAF